MVFPKDGTLDFCSGTNEKFAHFLAVHLSFHGNELEHISQTMQL